MRVLIFLLVLTTHTPIAQNSLSADDYSRSGIARFEKNELEGAIADFTKAIELKGQNREFCFYFRGIALYRLGKIDEALLDLTDAITLKQHPRFYNDRGNLRAQKGDLDGALVDLDKAIEIQPDYAKAYGDRALVRLMRGETTNAELDLKKCFALDATLGPHFNTAANRIKHQNALRTDHKTPTDVEVVEFTWKETPPPARVTPPDATIRAQTTDVSPTGLRILGDPSAKQPSPPPFEDPRSPKFPVSSNSNSRVQGVYYKFTASLKNTTTKTIIGVEWAYVFTSKAGGEPIGYFFTTKTNIGPGKDKELTDQMLSTVSSAVTSKYPTKHNRELFDERVVILRLDFADGTSWQR